MNFARGMITGVVLSAAVVGSCAAVWRFGWLKSSATAKSAVPPPATVAKSLKEEDINRIVLTAEAVERLALATAPAKRESLRRMRVYGGEVTVPAGQAVIVSAPISGLLRATPGNAGPQPGQTVKAGQPVLELLPLLTPEGQANLAATKTDADGQVQSARTQQEAAQIALARARRVYQSEAGSRRELDDAQARFDLAEKALEAATARRDLLERIAGEVTNGTTAPLAIESPAEGLVRSVSVRPGQNVPAGAPLFEVVDVAQVWIRTPVYGGDVDEIEAGGGAAIGSLAARPGERTWPAQPAPAPPSANAAAGTVDLYFALDNRQAGYRPGERVAVSVTLKDEAESLTVPWSAVIYDIYGGTWVYEQVGERAFARRRVSVRFVSSDTAALADGPAAGTPVVVAGAAELFGTETGFTK